MKAAPGSSPSVFHLGVQIEWGAPRNIDSFCPKCGKLNIPHSCKPFPTSVALHTYKCSVLTAACMHSLPSFLFCLCPWDIQRPVEILQKAFKPQNF